MVRLFPLFVFGSEWADQIHFPNAWANDQYWDGLGECVERGLIRAAGESHHRPWHRTQWEPMGP